MSEARGKKLFCSFLVFLLLGHSTCAKPLTGRRGNQSDPLVIHVGEESAVRKILQVSEERTVENDTFLLLRDEATDEQARSLAVAASTGQDHMISQLLAVGVDPDLNTAAGTPALWRAAFNDHSTTVLLLLGAGASIDATNSNGTTALYAAAQNGNLEIVDILISRGADVDVTSKWGSSPLLVASQQGFANIVEALMEAGASTSVRKAKSGQGAVWSAAYSGHNDVVEILIQNSAEFDLPDTIGTTPLFVAAQNNHLDVVETLLSAGANPNQVRIDKSSPLHTAAFHCHASVVSALVANRANKTLVNNMGNTALDVTCLEDGGDLLRHEGIMSGQEEQIVGQLAPLFPSARDGDTLVTNQLIQNGERPEDKLPNGWSVLHEGALGGSADVCRILLAAGAQPDSADQSGKTPAHIGAQVGAAEVIKVLHQHGANLNARDMYGKTPLHLAASAGKNLAISQLLGAGVPVDEIDNQGRSALHFVASSKQADPETLRLFLESEGDVNRQDEAGRTPLHVAVQSDNLETARELVKQGARVSTRDKTGKLPRDLIPAEPGSLKHQEYADLLEIPLTQQDVESSSIKSMPTDSEQSVEVSQLEPTKAPSFEHYGATAKSGISKRVLFFVIMFPGLFLCALCGVAIYIFKRSREGGIPSRWEKNNILDTPSTIWTELYVPSDGSVRSSSLPLRSRQGHLSQVNSDPSEQDVMSPGIFRNPYYSEAADRSRVETVCELEDASDSPANFRARPVPFGSTEIWAAPVENGRHKDSNPAPVEIPQRSCISFSDKGMSPACESPNESELQSKSERFMSMRPRTVPLPLHNMRMDIQRMGRHERNQTFFADAQSHFSSRSSKSLPSESAYFSAASAAGSRNLSQESFGSNYGEVYGLQGLQIPEGQEIRGVGPSGNLPTSSMKSASRFQNIRPK